MKDKSLINNQRFRTNHKKSLRFREKMVARELKLRNVQLVDNIARINNREPSFSTTPTKNRAFKTRTVNISCTKEDTTEDWHENKLVKVASMDNKLTHQLNQDKS